MLIIVCGLQGTGKTTVTKRVAKKLGAVVLRTDVIRKELTKPPKYSEKEKRRVYEEMFSRAKMLLLDGKHVVLDATFAKAAYRSKASKIAKEAKTGFRIVEVSCPEPTVKKRLEQRSKGASEATFEHYLQFKKVFEPVEKPDILVKNSGSLEDIDRQLDRHF